MVIPILEYASIVWGDKNNKGLMDSIQVLQNRAAKMVLDRAPHSSSTEALVDLNWVNLTTRRQMKRCLYMYNLINSDNRNNMIIRGSDHHSHNTRSKDTVRIIKSDTNWGLLRSLNSALLDWNSLPMEMRNLSYNAFRQGGGSNFPYILLNEIQTMFSQLAKQSVRFWSAEMPPTRAQMLHVPTELGR